MILTAAERVLVHLHGSWNAAEPGRESTQAGIADGARILRSHVPRTLRALLEEGLVEERDARLRGRTRRTTVYVLTPAGVARAREVLDAADRERVLVDGRETTLGEARQILGLGAVEAAAALRPDGTLGGLAPPSEERTLLQREEDLAALKRWRAGPAPMAVVYGSHGIGKTALGRAFARTAPRAVWIDVAEARRLSEFAAILKRDAESAPADPEEPTSVAAALLAAFGRGARLVVLDGYGDVPETLVDVLAAVLRMASEVEGAKVLVLAQETTPAYCRFYARKDVTAGLVVERHLKGLDLEGSRELLGNPRIGEEDLRRIYLLTKGCPLYLQFIREGDEYGLRQNSRFTTAEIRLLLYSRGAGP